MKTIQATRTTIRSDEAAHLRPAFTAVPGVSNKPMVPTAPASPAANPPRPLRRHIGQPVDPQSSHRFPTVDVLRRWDDFYAEDGPAR